MMIDAPEFDSSEPRVQNFIERVNKQPGELIPLKKLSPKGEAMWLEVRHYPVASKYCDTETYPHAFKRLKDLVLVDVFVPDASFPSGLRSIARRDWFIDQNDSASGGGDMRGALDPTEQRDIDAGRRWRRRGVGTSVEHDYENAGIGTFMTAISLPFLKKLGVKEVRVRILVKDEDGRSPIRSLWGKFGVEEREEPYPIEQLVSHSQVARSIAEFS